jgi:hypothetical protein
MGIHKPNEGGNWQAECPLLAQNGYWLNDRC